MKYEEQLPRHHDSFELLSMIFTSNFNSFSFHLPCFL